MSRQTTSRAGPLPHREAWPAVGRCVGASARMLVQREIHHPRTQVGRGLGFADGTTSCVYRETSVERAILEPSVLVVSFRLCAVRGRAHRAFEVESLLNTPLFVGFPGFTSKLWLAHDENDVYRGVYEWDGPAAAEHYARSLWRVLALVSCRGSIDFRVLPDLRRDVYLTDPSAVRTQEAGAWWQVVPR